MEAKKKVLTSTKTGKPVMSDEERKLYATLMVTVYDQEKKAALMVMDIPRPPVMFHGMKVILPGELDDPEVTLHDVAFVVATETYQISSCLHPETADKVEETIELLKVCGMEKTIPIDNSAGSPHVRH